ncbi:hypothetical protein, partial [Mesotoga prima]|uniref:hypothetical protein n=1 Tax=Mesotoga prima TaxID=1184387 RepID=UPI002D1FABAA
LKRRNKEGVGILPRLHQRLFAVSRLYGLVRETLPGDRITIIILFSLGSKLKCESEHLISVGVKPHHFWQKSAVQRSFESI